MKKTPINFQKGNGLIPVIIQDNETGSVLMLGYMNETALNKTQESGYVYFWSRSKGRLWLKGEESGNKLKVKSIKLDCDGDTMLILAQLIGKAACHTGSYSCFYKNIAKGKI
jgi:phosphoribosyl-AMP cyclohydrolase